MPVYYLKSPDLLDQFNEEAHALGIPDLQNKRVHNHAAAAQAGM